MRMTVDEIAALVKGQVSGDGSRIINGVASLESAGASDLSFLRAGAKASSLKKFQASAAGAVIVAAGLKETGRTLVEVKDPIAAFSKVLELVAEESRKPALGIHPLASVSPQAKIGKNCDIGPFCVVEDGAIIGDNVRMLAHVYIGAGSKIGNNTLIYPHVVIREKISIGAQCILHPGVIIGSDGFGFYHSDGKNHKIPQIGTVVIEDEVEIGSGTTVDRAMVGVTRIGKGVKLDNMVQIAHNVEIGDMSMIAAQVGIAGSAIVGKGVLMGGQVGVADHVTVGDGAQLAGKSGVMQDVDAGAVLFGMPAQPIVDAFKQFAILKRLLKGKS